MKSLKSININAREWFDSINGNSYFSAKIQINAGLESEEEIILPFQYGYDSMYLQQSLKKLQDLEYIPVTERQLPRYCRENEIPCTYEKEENCTKKQMYTV